MSRKSQQPDGGGKRGKKGRKGKKGATTETVTTVEEVVEPDGPPFGLVVLIALVMTLPSLVAFFDGALEFRPTIVKLLASLVVSWLLCQLVYSVMASFAKPAEETVTETTTTVTETTDPYGSFGAAPDADPYGEGRAAS